jgi:hypothetical protein
MLGHRAVPLTSGYKMGCFYIPHDGILPREGKQAILRVDDLVIGHGEARMDEALRSAGRRLGGWTRSRDGIAKASVSNCALIEP